jgi:multidrug transporter EmrE-like cation transporter
MILSGLMPVSLMFPIISAGGIVATFIISQVFYKEKLTKIQFVGFLTGLASIVFLSI